MAVNPTWVGDACTSADLAGISRAVILKTVNDLMPDIDSALARRLERVAAEKIPQKIPVI